MNVPRASQGFTLVEMLVALAIFAIAAMALMRLNIFLIAQASAIADARIASLVVDNEIAIATTDPGLTIGQSRSTVTNGGHRFDVVRRVSRTDDKRLVRIDIAAVETGGRGRAVLTAVRRIG